MDKNQLQNNNIDLRKLFLRFYSFIYVFIFSVVLSLFIAFLYLRYTDYVYNISSKIEIIDKAQDSEMALPTSMTIFNRSMINLENEIGRLSSFRLNQKVVSKLNSNVKFYNVGKFKTSEVHKSDFYEDYEIDFKINLDSITKRSYYYINVNEGNLEIKVHDKSRLILKSISIIWTHTHVKMIFHFN